jgi:hypothetical protein
MATVKSADAHSERKVVALLARFEFELFGRDVTRGHAAGRDEVCRRLSQMGDRLR